MLYKALEVLPLERGGEVNNPNLDQNSEARDWIHQCQPRTFTHKGKYTHGNTKSS